MNVCADDPWESGQLGCDEAYAQVADASVVGDADEAFGLRMVNIRLYKAMIDDLMLIGQAKGMGYKAIIRMGLQRFVEEELSKRY